MISGFNHVIIEEPWLPEVGTVTNASIISALNLAVENMKPLILTVKYTTNTEIGTVNFSSVFILSIANITITRETVIEKYLATNTFFINGVDFYFSYQDGAWKVVLANEV